MPLPEHSDIQLLAQVGFIAAGRADVPRALRIFEALALQQPERVFAYVGLTTALLNAGRAIEAVQRLHAVKLPDGPESDTLEVFRGLALQLAGHSSESTYVLRQVVRRARTSSGSQGALLAAQLLGEDLGAALRPEPVLST